jgi:hypothetical protein
MGAAAAGAWGATRASVAAAGQAQPTGQGFRPDLKILVFDTFGTVVDWRGTIIAEGQQLSQAKGLTVDWAAFADAWRAEYAPSMDRVRRGELPWTNLDGLHWMSLETLLPKFGSSFPERSSDRRRPLRTLPRPPSRRVPVESNGSTYLAFLCGAPWRDGTPPVHRSRGEASTVCTGSRESHS